jgi:hypothetical protein
MELYVQYNMYSIEITNQLVYPKVEQLSQGAAKCES